MSRLRRLGVWLADPKLAAFAAVVVVVSVCVPLCAVRTEQSLRISGLSLQLLGLAAAAVGIRDTRSLFGRPSFLEMLRGWFSRFPRTRSQPLQFSGEDRATASGSVSMEVWKGQGSNPTVDSRLKAAEENLLGLRKRMERAEALLEAEFRLVRQEIGNEAEKRAHEDRLLHLQIETASADGLNLAAVGVIWLAFGVVMATIPAELLALLR